MAPHVNMALREPLLGPPDACNESEHVHSQHAQHGAASSSSVDQRDDCEALLKLNGAHVSIEEDIEIPPKSTFWPCVFNLSKVVSRGGVQEGGVAAVASTCLPPLPSAHAYV